jgi:hypothetical protein
MLQEDLQNALRQIDELKAVSLKQIYFCRELGREIQCLQSKSLPNVRDSELRYVGALHVGLMVKCFPGIKL